MDGRKDHNVHGHVNTASDRSASDKNLVNFGSVTPEFISRACVLERLNKRPWWAHAGLC